MFKLDERKLRKRGKVTLFLVIQRTFHFQFENEEDYEEWTIYFDFSRAKAIYDDFVNNFGKISFPLNINNIQDDVM